MLVAVCAGVKTLAALMVSVLGLRDLALGVPGGGFAVIESTRALIAVDVNTGRDTTPAAALKVNIALARELPRQLRLRGLGGQIVIDFAPSAKRDRGTIEQVLRAAEDLGFHADTAAHQEAQGVTGERRRRRDGDDRGDRRGCPRRDRVEGGRRPRCAPRT